MNLIDLKRKIRESATFINYLKAEINELRNPLKVTDTTKEIVSGSRKRQDTSDVIAKIVEMEQDLEIAQRGYDRMISTMKELEKGYEELGERDKRIYIEYWLKNYSTVKIGCRYGISDRQVRNILKNIEHKLEKDKKIKIDL